MESIKGKHILIAGATGGIGSETAALLAASGADLYLSGRNNRKLQEVAEACKVSAEKCFIVNIENETEVTAMASAVHSYVPQIDVLINAAGIGIIRPVSQLSVQDLKTSLDTNITGPFNLIRAFLPNMKASGKGLIINIPGALGKVPMAGAAAYSASKFGLTGLMQSIREELKRTEIRVTNLFMGGVDSPFWDTIDLRVQREKMISSKEAARAIWFLCQQPSSGVISELVLQPFNHQAI